VQPLTADERAGLIRASGLSGGEVRSLLAERAQGYFRADLLPGRGWVEAGFAVVLVLDGSGTVSSTRASLDVGRGAALVVPWAAGRWQVDGDVTVVVCRPPLPAAAVSAP
jgi:mannose-6-phosphate isomerase